VQAGRAKREDSRFREQAAALAQKVRSVRLARGLTQEQVAGRAQVAVSTLRKIESGRVVEPGFFTMVEIAEVLDLPLTDLNRRNHATKRDETRGQK
jgi:transcriptional regulator with XRE-family HTH domain